MGFHVWYGNPPQSMWLGSFSLLVQLLLPGVALLLLPERKNSPLPLAGRQLVPLPSALVALHFCAWRQLLPCSLRRTLVVEISSEVETFPGEMRLEGFGPVWTHGSVSLIFACTRYEFAVLPEGDLSVWTP